MTLFAELSGNQLTEAVIVIPLVGVPHARVTLSKEVVVPSTGLVLTVADLTMRCSLARAARPFQGTTSLLLVGGAGGWGKRVTAEGYSSSAGVRLSLVLSDLARAVGETIEIGEDRTIGPAYSREDSVACTHLNTLVESSWRVDLDGVTRTGARPGGAIASTFTITSYDGVRGACAIATEHPGDFLPGRTFQGATFKSALTIGGVSHVLSKGAVRTEVLAS